MGRLIGTISNPQPPPGDRGRLGLMPRLPPHLGHRGPLNSMQELPPAQTASLGAIMDIQPLDPPILIQARLETIAEIQPLGPLPILEDDQERSLRVSKILDLESRPHFMDREAMAKILDKQSVAEIMDI